MTDRDRGGAAQQGVSYILVGVGTAAFEWGLFRLLYELCGVPLAISNVAATVLATAANFALNRSVTFKSSSNPVRSAIAYLTLFVFNTAVSTFVIGALVSIGVPSAIAKLCMQCCVVVWNFVLYRTVVFK